MQTGNIPGIANPVSRLILGSMVCNEDDMDNTSALLDAYVAAGGTAVDTAHIYGGGKSERGLGKWIQAKNNREKIIIVGKGAHHDASGPRVNAAAITKDLTESLERLQTDYIDLYLLHRDDPNVEVGPIVECLHSHREAGRIRAYGGSNWTTDRIQQANDYAAEHGLISFAASSPHYSLARTSGPMWAGCHTLTSADFSWHAQHQFPLLPWSSQASGFFTGRYNPDVHTNADVERTYYAPDNWKRLERATELAAKKGATANQIALAWVLRVPFPIFPLVGPRNVEELKSTLPALDITLSQTEHRWLNLDIDSLE